MGLAPASLGSLVGDDEAVTFVSSFTIINENTNNREWYMVKGYGLHVQ